MPGIECVAEPDLTAFLLGRLPEPSSRLVSRHLEACAECEAAARRLDRQTDPVLRALRRAVRPADDGATLAPPGRADATAQAAVSLPQRIAGYEVLEELGRGGMSVVYKARQARPERLVALKMLLGGLHADPARRARLLAEADAIARLRHPNIVQIYEVGQHDGLPFLSLEYVGGGSLAQHLHGQPQGPRQAAALVEVLARAVQHAHEAGVVHRDLKPSNVLLASTTGNATGRNAAGRNATEGVPSSAGGNALRGVPGAELVPKITDFGLAKQERPELTATGAILGTPSYMAPEQAAGNKAAGPAVDVHALGAILYECLTGRPPFQGPTVLDTLEQVRSQEPVSPSQLQMRLPPDLCTICLKCLRKEPGQRYASAGDLADDLGRFLAGRPIQARPVGTAERAWRWCRRNPTVAGLTGAVLGLLLAVAVVATVSALRLKGQRDRVAEAERKARLREAEALVGQAHGTRLSRRPGQRFASLAALGRAAAIGRELGQPPEWFDRLRTEAIACLLLPDLEAAKEWDGWPRGSTCFAIDPSFQRYARGDRAGSVSVRRISDDVELFRLDGGPGEVFAYEGLEFSPDRRHLHHGCQTPDGARWRVWRLDGPEPVVVLSPDYPGDARSPALYSAHAFSPDGRQFAAAWADGSIRVFDLETRRELKRYPGDWPRLQLLCWNRRRPLLAMNTGRGYRLLDLATGEARPEVAVPGGVGWMDWHPDGHLLAVGGNTRAGHPAIYVWDIRTGRLALPPLEGHKTQRVLVRFNHAGDRLLSTDWTHNWRLWDTRTGQLLLTQPAGGFWLHFSADDRLVGVDATHPRLRLFRFRSGQELRSLTHSPAAGVAGYHHRGPLSPEGRLLAVDTAEGVVFVDVLRGKEIGLLAVPGTFPLQFEPTGALLTYGPAGVLRWPVAVDAEKGRRRYGPPQRLHGPTNGDYHGGSADGRVLAIPRYSRGALVLHRPQGRIVPLGPQADVRSCAVSPDGRWVATGSHGDGGKGIGAKVWVAAAGGHVRDLPVGNHCWVSFSPDRKWLLTTGGGFRLWSVGTWAEGPALGGPAAPTGAAFSADGSLLALEDVPGVVRLVVPATGKEVARLSTLQQTRLFPQCFTPDGARLVCTGLDDHVLYLFDLRLIRAGLAELGLDWAAPPVPKAHGTARPAPLEVTFDQGDLAARRLGEDAQRQAHQLRCKGDLAGALAVIQKAQARMPDDAGLNHYLAYLLAICPDPKRRNARRAVELARKAVAAEPNTWEYLRALGLARHFAGDDGGAVQALTRSLKLRGGGGDGFDFFLLAAAHGQLRHKDEARRWYDRGVAWMAANKHEYLAELSVLRADAEARLGIGPRSKPAPDRQE